MNMKKVLTVLFTAAMFITVCMGCNGINSKDTPEKSGTAKEDTRYSQHYKYSVLTFEGPELLEWPIVKEAMKKFNVEFNLVTKQYDAWPEKLRTMVASDTLPEFIAWYNFQYGEYVDWVKQGVFKPIPDLSKYPNIKKSLDGIQADDYMYIDNKLYCIPKVINANPFNDIGYENYYFRKDWADKVGEKFKTVQEITWEDFVKYLKNIKRSNPSSVGSDKLIPLDIESGFSDIHQVSRIWNPYMGKYIKRDGKYVWGTALPQTVDALKALQQMYREGLIAEDFYSYKSNEGRNRYRAGRSAVLYSYLSPALMQAEVDEMKKASPSFKDEDYGVFVVKSPSGKVNCVSKIEFWAASAYSAKIDDKKMDRMLQIHNWALDDKTVEKLAFGVPGVDWNLVDGKVKLSWPKDSKGNYLLTKENGKDYIRDEWLFQKWFKLEGDDVWIPGNDFYRKTILKTYENSQRLKEKVGALVIGNDWNMDFISAPNKNKYEVFEKEANKEITELIISSDNIEKDWNHWLKSMEPKVNSVLDEINSKTANK